MYVALRVQWVLNTPAFISKSAVWMFGLVRVAWCGFNLSCSPTSWRVSQRCLSVGQLGWTEALGGVLPFWEVHLYEGCLWTTNYVRKVKWETAGREWNPHKTQTKETNKWCFLLGLMDCMIECRNRLRMAGLCDFQRKSQGFCVFVVRCENVSLPDHWQLLPSFLSEHHFPSRALHLLLSVTGTWLRRTWRTPPSGWERASVPPCAPCWASLCTERFSNSGDGMAPNASLQLPLLTLLLPFSPERLLKHRLSPWPCPLLQFTCTAQRKCGGKPFYMHTSNSV